jgi:hypothetical protein
MQVTVHRYFCNEDRELLCVVRSSYMFTVLCWSEGTSAIFIKIEGNILKSKRIFEDMGNIDVQLVSKIAQSSELNTEGYLRIIRICRK